MKERPLLIAVAACLLVLAVSSLMPGDFQTFHQAARTLVERGNPYEVEAFRKVGFAYLPGALLLALGPSLFPYKAALVLWDALCLLAYLVSIKVWAGLLWRTPRSRAQLAGLVLAGFIAPCLWSFFFHQLSPFLLLFASLAVMVLAKGGSPLLCGLAFGAACLKPPLMVFLGAQLLARSRGKAKFLCGFVLACALPLLPFVSGWRPLADLGDMARAWGIHAQLLCRDDQSLASNLYRLVDPSLGERLAPYNKSGMASFAVPEEEITPLRRFKLAFFLAALALWLVYLWRRREDFALEAAMALAMGVVLGPYSHAYDGLLLIPLVLWAVRTCVEDGQTMTAGGALFLAGLAAACVLPVRGSQTVIVWESMRLTSLAYAAACAAALSLTGRSRS